MKRLLAIVALAALMPAQAAAPRIPLVEGLVLSYAQQAQAFDEEFLITVSATSETEVEFSVIAQRALKDGERQDHTWTRRVRRQDLVAGNRRNPVLQEGDPALFAGASFIQLSAAVLNELKTAGESAVVVASIPGYGKLATNALLAFTPSGRKYYRGPMKRIGKEPLTITVLVNGEKTALPAIRTQGHYSVGSEAEDSENWWLDDAENALPLRSITGKLNSQLVRIDYPQPKAAESVLEAALSEGDCRAALHGIYFNTGSAALLSQSDPALQQIADLLKANPGWIVAVEGHTDNVGAAAYNLDLSRRRATAVRDALVQRHGIAAKRLPAEGYGAGKPVAPNDTLEGRAANRRVELARQCS